MVGSPLSLVAERDQQTRLVQISSLVYAKPRVPIHGFSGGFAQNETSNYRRNCQKHNNKLFLAENRMLDKGIGKSYEAAPALFEK